MMLAIDIGNTNIVLGCVEGKKRGGGAKKGQESDVRSNKLVTW